MTLHLFQCSKNIQRISKVDGIRVCIFMGIASMSARINVDNMLYNNINRFQLDIQFVIDMNASCTRNQT